MVGWKAVYLQWVKVVYLQLMEFILGSELRIGSEDQALENVEF